MNYRDFQIGDALLINADMRDVLPRWPDPVLGGPPDLLVTDPPYKLSSGGNNHSPGHKKMRGKFASENYANDGNICLCDITWKEWLPLAYAALRDPAHAYIFSDDGNELACEEAAIEAGFEKHNKLIWDKVQPTANRWYMQQAEYVLFARKGAAFQITDCGSKNIIRMSRERRSGHPNEKPVSLLAHFIRQSSRPGDLVLDPFMGGGSTAIAALKEGRRFVGIELDAGHYATTVARVQQWVEGGQMDFDLLPPEEKEQAHG